MKYRPVLLLVLLFFPALASAQAPSHQPEVAQDSAVSATEESIKLEIEYHGKRRVSEALIQRIFRETMHEVAWQLNPEHPPRIVANVTLRLGTPGFTVETLEGKERLTILSLPKWDELLFARMVARAARNGMFSDQELDQHARAGLTRARAVTSLSELQGR